MSFPKGASEIYSYSSGNILASADGNTYTHDANGNRTSKTNGTNVTTYSYDSLNRLVQTVKGPQTTQYIYNGLGQRTGRIDNGVRVNYLIDPNRILPQVLAETDNTGNLIAYYVYDGVGLVAKISSQNQYYFYHYDGLGSTIAITDSAGQVVNTYCYSPEGLVGVQETIPNPFTYVGRLGVMAEGNGLYSMRARYYDPETGSFISKDPIGYVGGMNLYTYVGNSLLSFVDPLGLIEGSPANLSRRWLISFFASAYTNSQDYNYSVRHSSQYPANSWKCSAFVCDVLRQAGTPVSVTPKGGKSRCATAGELANKRWNPKDWRILGAGETPQPGDIAAYASLTPQPGVTGHTGIITGKGGISAHKDGVYVEPGQFDPSVPNILYRRYTGE